MKINKDNIITILSVPIGAIFGVCFLYDEIGLWSLLVGAIVTFCCRYCQLLLTIKKS